MTLGFWAVHAFHPLECRYAKLEVVKCVIRVILTKIVWTSTPGNRAFCMFYDPVKVIWSVCDHLHKDVDMPVYFACEYEKCLNNARMGIVNSHGNGSRRICGTLVVRPSLLMLPCTPLVARRLEWHFALVQIDQKVVGRSVMNHMPIARPPYIRSSSSQRHFTEFFQCSRTMTSFPVSNNRGICKSMSNSRFFDRYLVNGCS